MIDRSFEFLNFRRGRYAEMENVGDEFGGESWRHGEGEGGGGGMEVREGKLERVLQHNASNVNLSSSTTLQGTMNGDVHCN